ncbi:hypothetical protein [Flavisphingomonas formosensis]|uniref:hypothetical protein n=1 Tax=Flavisphingomonas formosensis TaxID=861534 RepID=UPI0018DEFDB4|nr:hypothetical protein [Sphingomonas formosensis]
MARMKTAFALAGLGGFNAHGAGFLEAARANAYQADLITATSGQIVVLAAFLGGEPDLRKGLIDPAVEGDPLAQLKIALFGYKGVFEPAYIEALKRFLTPPYLGFGIDFFADRFLPAQLYKPARTAESIQTMVDIFNAPEQVGVVFNSYDPSSGRGALYGNDAARDLLLTKKSLPVPADQRGHDPRITESDDEEPILPIDNMAIEAALWLSLYGFAGMPTEQMDGAYHRSCILSELHGFDDVIVCRPLANGWRKADLPENYFDVQDWNTEMWFSVGYKAEVDAMKRINALVKKGVIDPKAGMKYVDIHEIEPVTPAGYFNYFIERDSVFEDARAKADRLFKWLIGGKKGQRPG